MEGVQRSLQQSQNGAQEEQNSLLRQCEQHYERAMQAAQCKHITAMDNAMQQALQEHEDYEKQALEEQQRRLAEEHEAAVARLSAEHGEEKARLEAERDDALQQLEGLQELALGAQEAEKRLREQFEQTNQVRRILETNAGRWRIINVPKHSLDFIVCF